ncbi:MAG: DUF167 domain-containing protein [Candidatus Peribacteraceae bacterium]
MSASAVITVRVRPGASATKITDILSDGTIKIDLAAPAEDGKANAELVRFIAAHHSVPKENVRIVSGQTSRKKLVRIVAPSH